MNAVAGKIHADRYHGEAARGYDAHRRNSAERKAEMAAVEQMVTDGPVLDCPVGTGVYLDIYRAKGIACVGVDISPDMIAEAHRLHPGHDLRRGDIFRLAFGYGEFETAVCARFLNWCDPHTMPLAIRALRRVARQIVVSIRTGEEGIHGNYTHDLANFYRAIDGLHIASRIEIARVASGIYEMFKLRPPSIDDVLAQFGIQTDGENAGVRLARTWTDHFGVPSIDWAHAAVMAEYWPGDRIGAMIDSMAEIGAVGGRDNGIVTDDPPRRDHGPLTVLRCAGREVLLDGRRRANLWRDRPGLHPVLTVCDARC